MNLIWNDLIGIFDRRKIIILNYIKSGTPVDIKNIFLTYWPIQNQFLEKPVRS